MNKKVGIINYGSGNFTSVWNSMLQVSNSVIEVKDARGLSRCSHLVLPGVGAFTKAVAKLSEMELFTSLQQILKDGDRPFLGICVGMQILAETGDEFVRTDGLGIISADVRRFDFCDNESRRLPHMGWNDVKGDNYRLLAGIPELDKSFYFVHSYHMQVRDEEAQVCYTDYGYEFVSAISKANCFGVQFHPEKSQKNGGILLSNFLSI